MHALARAASQLPNLVGDSPRRRDLESVAPSLPRTPDPEAAVAWFENLCVARRDARARRAAAPTHGAFSSRAEASAQQVM